MPFRIESSSVPPPYVSAQPSVFAVLIGHHHVIRSASPGEDFPRYPAAGSSLPQDRYDTATVIGWAALTPRGRNRYDV